MSLSKQSGSQSGKEFKSHLLEVAFNLIREAGVTEFNQVSYCYDLASYVVRAAGLEVPENCNVTYLLEQFGFTPGEIGGVLVNDVSEKLYFGTEVDLIPDNWLDILKEDIERIKEKLT